MADGWRWTTAPDGPGAVATLILPTRGRARSGRASLSPCPTRGSA